MSPSLSLKGNSYVTILSNTTMTNPVEGKEECYSILTQALTKVPKEGRLIIAADMNARVGCEDDKWQGVIGPHETEKCSSNTNFFLSLCSEFSFVTINSIFNHLEDHKNPGRNTLSKHWHLLDYIMTKNHLNIVHDTLR